jgi:hypothetical protein
VELEDSADPPQPRAGRHRAAGCRTAAKPGLKASKYRNSKRIPAMLVCGLDSCQTTVTSSLTCSRGMRYFKFRLIIAAQI